MSIAFLSSRFTQERPETIFRGRAPGFPIEVQENTRYRWLTFGNGVVQSAMSRAEPRRLLLPYTQSMLAPLIFDDAPASILSLGVGGGSLARYVHAYLPETTFTAVDISGEVIETAQRFFGLPDRSDRFAVEITDAREALADAVAQDLILADIFDAEGMPAWVTSTPTLQAARRALAAHGTLVINLMPDDEGHLARCLRPIRNVFAGHVLCTTLVDYRNVIVIAFREAPSERVLRTLGRRAHQLEKRFRIPLGRILRNISGVNLCHQGRLVV